MKISFRTGLISGLLCTVAPLGCSMPAEEDAGSVGSLEQPLQSNFAYLRCNATGWNVTSANRFVATSNPNVFVLDYAVTLPWLASSPDSCLLTQTNQLDGFGTTQTNYQAVGGALNVPGTRNLAVGWQQIAVRYPALGTYRATFDLAKKTLTIGAQPTVAWRWPLAGQNGLDWVINNYVDGPAPGPQDYTGGTRTYDGHQGVDIDISTFRNMDAGVNVLSVGSGKVIAIEESQPDRNTACVSSNWNYVTIAAPGGLTLTYGHLKTASVVVSVGDTVKAGDVLGLVGSSGCSTQPHLHLEAYDSAGSLIDPFARGLWQQPPSYLVPLKIMDLVVNDFFFSSLDSLKDPAPNIAELRPPYELTAALSVGGGTVGDTPGLRLVLPNGTVFDELQFPFDSGPLGHSYWYWTRGLGSEPTTGTWRVEALANGIVTRTHSFRVVR